MDLLSFLGLTEDKSLSTHRTPSPKARKADADAAAFLHSILGVQHHANRDNEYKAKFATMQTRFQAQLQAMVESYDKRHLSRGRMFDRASRIFQHYYLEAFTIGVRSADMSGSLRLGKKTVITPADKYWVRTAAQKEFNFWKKAIGSRKDWKHSPRTRIAMYGQSLQATYDAGRVVGMPSLMAIDWVVNDGLENCQACLWLERNSPWTKDTIPTQPRAGETPCLFNCGCQLQSRPIHADEYEDLAGKGSGRNRKLIRQQLKLMR